MTQAFNLSQLANFVNSSGQLDASVGLTNTSAITFPTGTLMLFQQTAAPTGWTKQTTHNNKALRVVSGTASTGGSVAFTTAFASGLSAESTTLSTVQMPSHGHDLGVGVWFSSVPNGEGNWPGSQGWEPRYSTARSQVPNTGGGGSHNHSLPSFDVAYVDLIIASKN